MESKLTARLRTAKKWAFNLLVLVLVAFFAAYFYREITSEKSVTQLKLDNFYLSTKNKDANNQDATVKDTNNKDKKAESKAKTQAIKFSKLMPGDYDRLCIGHKNQTLQQVETAFGRTLTLEEKAHFLWMTNTGGDFVYGTQFIYEKNAKIFKIDAVAEDVKLPKSYGTYGCLPYQQLYLTSNADKNYQLHVH